jgi:hypothetical protein
VPGAPGYLYPAKLRVSRSRVLRSDRCLDVYAPITSRARGEVEVTYQGDRRTKTFAAEVTAGDATLDRIRFKEPITAGQARLGTGIVTLNYQGDGDTRPEEVRLRAASQHADLAVEEISLLDGRLSARGSVTSRARGIVRLRYSYLDAAGQPQIYPARATIQQPDDLHRGPEPPGWPVGHRRILPPQRRQGHGVVDASPGVSVLEAAGRAQRLVLMAHVHRGQEVLASVTGSV